MLLLREVGNSIAAPWAGAWRLGSGMLPVPLETDGDVVKLLNNWMNDIRVLQWSMRNVGRNAV